MVIPRPADELWGVVAPLLPPAAVEGRASLRRRLRRTMRHPLRAVDRLPLVRRPPRARRRQPGHLAMAPARLAGGERLEAAHQALLDRPGGADWIEWERTCLDSADVPRGATQTAAPPPAASRAARSTSRPTPRPRPANRHDSTVLEAMFGARPVGRRAEEPAGCHRWVVERRLAWLRRLRRLVVRHERREDLRQAFTLGCCLICHRHLPAGL